jgi:TetR/AcrR family transcriptional regulator, transcriptional repressor for nem operon
MRYDPAHKEESRQKILEAAARQFRGAGAEAVRVADVMQAAGLTHGGFYKHFADKDELFVAAVRTALAQTATDIVAVAQGSTGPAALRKLIGFYLSEAHLNNPVMGCALAALGSEIARLPEAMKLAINAALEDYVSRLEVMMPGESCAQRRAAFMLLFPAMAGYLITARAYVSQSQREQILSAGRRFLEQAFCADAGPAIEDAS